MQLFAFDSFEAITFDCYGTLIDWECGILRVLRPLLADRSKRGTDEQILELYAELEPAVQSREYLPYRTVLEEVVRAIGQHFGFSVSTDEARSLARSLKGWMPFPDTVAALGALKTKYRLGIISNTDDDLFSDTPRHLQVAFDWVITAGQARAYKPGTCNFRTGVAENRPAAGEDSARRAKRFPRRNPGEGDGDVNCLGDASRPGCSEACPPLRPISKSPT